MLENLGKPVILTGAQVPLAAQRSDGVSNLLGALIIAGHYVIPEVCIFFHHNLVREIVILKLYSFPNPRRTGLYVDYNWLLIVAGCSTAVTDVPR